MLEFICSSIVYFNNASVWNMEKNLLLATCILTLGILGCQKKDPIIPNEEEVISAIVYTLTPEKGGTMKIISVNYLGGNTPVYRSDTLEAHTTYYASVQFLNEFVSPVTDITEEVQDEANDHQIFYQSNLNDLLLLYDDADTNGFPVGLKSKLITGKSSSGELSIILRHLPEKAAEGVKSGNITNAGGETDVEINFLIYVQ